MTSILSGSPADAGIFVSFEGGDGSGKTTQIGLLGDWFARLGHEVVVTREPGGTTLGAELRRLVLHGEDMVPRTEALLYAADRAHHVSTVVRPALGRGAVVVTDRYLDSSVAYQAGGRELGADEVENLSLWATGGLLPHVTVLLDIDPAVGVARVPGGLDRLERAGDEFHVRTREAYLARAAAHPERIVVVDASQPVEEVHALVVAAVAGHLGIDEATSVAVVTDAPAAADGPRA
ncbi:dTMP kinase [Sanguibacter sp. HDW7]|uniref:dTMP kinase n=1 Tax=Sanguibacter sp. HDW7 TaxID=2714931 RepID=UPI00140C6F14|nr:dTMP kinase [Sanguibacter sp. HDW7]QIK84427.1 dTMP kinase [Sanguibacter sp. HDW7]